MDNEPVAKRLRQRTANIQENQSKLSSISSSSASRNQKRSVNNMSEYPFCNCRKEIGGEMIACDQKGCKNEWYHLECLGIIKVPSGKWYCPKCKTSKSKKSKKSVTFADDTKNQNDMSDEQEDQNDLSEGFCNCKKKPDEFMIECKSPDCPGKFFHLPCVNLKDFPDPEDWCCSHSCRNVYDKLNEGSN